jgi:hypothetical protein
VHALRSTRARHSLSAALVACSLTGAERQAQAADLKPQTVAAFERYVTVSETRIAGEIGDASRFLWIDTLPPERRRTALDALRRGEFLIDRPAGEDASRQLDIPDGLVHHWIGVVFIPGATVDRAVALLQDYNRHAEIYKPAIAASKILSRDGDHFRVHLRFFMKKVITVVLNSEHDARFTRLAPDRAHSRIVSTRIAEVENPGTPGEREKPVGRDGGYLWRINSYWRFLERDGGVYVQCESISLSRGIPTGFGWLVGPFVTSIPRESLAFTLETTRRVLTNQKPV